MFIAFRKVTSRLGHLDGHHAHCGMISHFACSFLLESMMYGQPSGINDNSSTDMLREAPWFNIWSSMTCVLSCVKMKFLEEKDIMLARLIP
ncbi:hypothetical protein L6452_27983 [Arctium lappa]|uniref:Uncharacterized protein n=1 Tax=Arctium lappa TaxID=4217 RepID=A0ACB8ZXG5_ARCLA|nr:hypothetical protein L6452_27983 [Arctium lappa]